MHTLQSPSHPSLLLFLPFIFILLDSSLASPILLQQVCGTTGTFTANTTYQQNLNSLLSTLYSKTPISGFANATVGQIPEQSYGLALCRGDINATECIACLKAAGPEAQQLCSYEKGATIWYDECTLRYSNDNFLTSFDNLPEFWMWNRQDAADVARFNQLMYAVLNQTADRAVSKSRKNFATGQIGNYSNEYPTIYAATQCTPDMSGGQCMQCLQDLFEKIPTKELNGKDGGRMGGVRCNFRYALNKFYEGNDTVSIVAGPVPSVAPEPSPATAPASDAALTPLPAIELPQRSEVTSGKKTILVISVAVPALGVATLVIAAICLWRRKLNKTHDENKQGNVESEEPLFFNLTTIQVATANFSDENKIGQGGFGEVYKGLLPDGTEIAVKKLLTNSLQGLGELKNELVLVAKLQHRNLLRVLGVCVQEEKMIIYEYVPNKSLDKFLFDPVKRQLLNWEIRHKIICGIARGLQYLHEESQLKVIHRDLKASNVLLDAEMNPKIADFGLAKLFHVDQTQANTNRIVGTHGYMAPEYKLHGHFSNKSDIFSFGVLVLEIITGRKNNNAFSSGRNLISIVWDKWRNGSISETLDPIIAQHGLQSEMLTCIHIALLCVQEKPLNRPDMSTINVMLSSDTVSLAPPLRPGLFVYTIQENSNNNESERSESYEYGARGTQVSHNDVSITELEPR